MTEAPNLDRPRLLMTVATSILAIGAVVGIYFVASRPSSGGPRDRTPSEAGQQLVEGHDYRVLVTVVRVRPGNPEGEPWDSGAKSSRAPDPFCEVWWRGNRVYKSQEVENVLVASWGNVALPKLHKLLADEKLSFESIKEGALITARPDDSLKIRIWDDDPFKNDLIEEFDVPLAELRVGDQVREGRQGLESVTLRVIPRDSNELEQLTR